jgi:probable F420-dependent oxidoreductase
MLEVAGEVADGLIVHPFNSRRSLDHIVMPALERGRAAAGRAATEVEIVWVQMVVTWTTDEERATALQSAREQMAFYGSTPAYAPVLDLHGYADLHPELNRLSKMGRWDEMAALIPDDLIEQLAVVGSRRDIAGKVNARSVGIADTVSLVNNRNPDPANFADIVTDLQSAMTGAPGRTDG